MYRFRLRISSLSLVGTLVGALVIGARLELSVSVLRSFSEDVADSKSSVYTLYWDCLPSCCLLGRHLSNESSHSQVDLESTHLHIPSPHAHIGRVPRNLGSPWLLVASLGFHWNCFVFRRLAALVLWDLPFLRSSS